MPIRSSIYTFLAAALAGSLFLGPALGAPPTLTLDQAIAMALDNNPEIAASTARFQASVGRARQAKYWPNPELTATADDWPMESGGGFGEAKQMVGLAQHVPFPGKKRLDRQLGQSGVALSRQELLLRERELVHEVKTAFYRALAAENMAEVAAGLVETAESSALAVRNQAKAGAASEQEILRAEIPWEEAKAELAGHRHEMEVAKQELAEKIGRWDLAAASLAGTLATASSPSLLEQQPDSWLPLHPQFMAAQEEVLRAQLEGRRAQKQPYPDVRVEVGGGRDGGTGEALAQVGISLPLPIFDRGAGRIHESQANLRAAEAELAAARNRLLAAWGAAASRLRTAARQADAYRERTLPKADSALRLVRAGFEQGKFGFIDLLDSQRTAAEVRLSYQQKLLDLNLARAQLEALLPPQTPATRRTQLTDPNKN